ncbi:hypothetical protein E8F20_24465 [Pseudomonas sp. BN415]|uniref:hypothetical protein n=1 Tax=Pseudomonas sp. BN415 TaxID=2567889 RepID=UPI002457DA51|nr:hypothetical protein [Pseudomonas sp. BN415]MDH4585023.1 hypothetical protein [Pseudomonas sp. BN415]
MLINFSELLCWMGRKPGDLVEPLNYSLRQAQDLFQFAATGMRKATYPAHVEMREVLGSAGGRGRHTPENLAAVAISWSWP